ncbi:hypothetical protein M406DRAFT_264927 [Cryphonectria parasitica EP155]|uniref:N-acetyltransferase B complex non catalytic subunit n=1 Tax=Cryphonectria parasitica (strain ATCC 38755 / EP155) TaxID=660469 RepID=A0A9P4XWV4_CRYP1|nr:uncharacterized protein M406DRAFT_264927 [Cryphonectria parasitica EP155]KAF3762774.1 hypothetical protein M406DRAFT_264927 [Cryphonectria parasitica EP155]
MSAYSRHYRPALKDSVDVQLQAAFNEGQWSSVIRLAAQRFKNLKDSYYEAVRICAESQTDAVTEKSGVVTAVNALVRDKTAALDIDIIELYEWALQDSGFPFDYSKTIGTLRARVAKANPSSPVVLECLEACVLAWDLVNAQQIAATLDRVQTGKNDGKSLYWSITLTHLLAASRCPFPRPTVFTRLARMQLEKAANATTAAATGKVPTRGLREEEEINLYYRIIGKDAYLKSVADRDSAISVFKQFDQGRKHLLIETLNSFEEAEDWDNVYDLCRYALSRQNEDGNPSFLAFDMRIWKLFVKAASMKSDVESAFDEAATTLDKFVSTKGTVAPMYKKNIGLVTLELAFQDPSCSVLGTTGPERPSPRVITLYLILEQSLSQRAAFDDVKEYVSQLSGDEARYFIDNFSRTLLAKTSDDQRKILVRVLEVKFRYLLTTCPSILEHVVVVGDAEEPQLKCKLCSALTDRACRACLEAVASTALSAYKVVEKNPEHAKGLDKDPQIDLALVAASALLKLSGLSPRPVQTVSARLPRLSNTNVSRLLQAVVILAAQLTRTTDEVPLRLVLIQIYLLLGCGSLAYQTWLPMDIKRTIQDALSPLFFDRISSIFPGLFQQSRTPPTEPLTSYYTACLREDSPVRIWDAFKAGSYTSILGMAEFSDRLRRSCTLAMTVIEERRATRALGGRLEGGIQQAHLLHHVTDDTRFVNAIDHGSFPNLESPQSAPLYKIVEFGPDLSSERCRLALLAEQFLDTVTYKPPKDYKPSKVNEVALRDRAYLIETSARLHESISSILLNISSSIAGKLTGAEHHFYSTVSFLSLLLRTALETPKSVPQPRSLSTITTGIKSVLASLWTDFASVPPQLASLDAGDVLASLTDPHTLSIVRETALVIKQTATLILTFHAAEQTRDRTGSSHLHKDIVAEAKGLDELATKTLSAAKERVKELKNMLGQGGWLARIEGWTFPEGEDALGEMIRDVVGVGDVEDWAGKVVESWRDGVKGFEVVKWE